MVSTTKSDQADEKNGRRALLISDTDTANLAYEPDRHPGYECLGRGTYGAPAHPDFCFEYNEEMIREAIVREMARGGQVYYVFNRVKQIADVAAKIEELVPEANVAYAHGKMTESRLEKIVYGFINQEIDVLVSTTIIEIGLDISNVNTIIIHDADQLGLSQLYQNLRGRVGKSNRSAYAFFDV